MNELHDLLDEISTPEHDLPLDGHTLLAQGRRRVRRRRVVAATCLSLAALGAVGLGVTHHGPATTFAGEPTSYADVDLTPLSTAEVEARCQAQMTADNNGEVTSFVIPDVLLGGSSVQQPPHPWHVGLRVYGVPASDPQSSDATGCIIPDSGADPAPITVADDPAQVRQICSGHLRTDLTGWQQLAVAVDGHAEAALFRSGNGYVADCYAQQTRMGIQAAAGVMPESRWYGADVCSPNADGHVDCYGTGRVGDHTATAVDVTLPSGKVVRTVAVEGYWAVAVPDDAGHDGSDLLKAVAVP